MVEKKEMSILTVLIVTYGTLLMAVIILFATQGMNPRSTSIPWLKRAVLMFGISAVLSFIEAWLRP